MTDGTTSTRSWLAALLNLVLPGSGHVYVGRVARFAGIFAPAIALYCGLGLAGKLSAFPYYVTALSGLLAVRLIAVVDAYVVSRIGQSVRGKWYQRWWAYLLILAATIAMSVWFPAHRESIVGVGVHRVPSATMEPTIHVGELTLADSWAYRHTAPAAGDVVIYHDRNTDGRYVRRVVAVHGGTVDLTWDNKRLGPPGYSVTVPVADVQGRVTSILLSPTLSRIGKRIE